MGAYEYTLIAIGFLGLLIFWGAIKYDNYTKKGSNSQKTPKKE